MILHLQIEHQDSITADNLLDEGIELINQHRDAIGLDFFVLERSNQLDRFVFDSDSSISLLVPGPISGNKLSSLCLDDSSIALVSVPG